MQRRRPYKLVSIFLHLFLYFPLADRGNSSYRHTALRIRPTTQQDLSSIPARFQRTVIHAISTNAVAVDQTPSAQSAGSSGSVGPLASSSSPAKKQTFAFDQVHGQETSQYELYQSTAEPLISRFLEGFNCTILAYGQTSSGKTYVPLPFCIFHGSHFRVLRATVTL